MFLLRNLDELLNGPLLEAYAAMRNAHQKGLSCLICYKQIDDPKDVCTCSPLTVRCVKVGLNYLFLILDFFA